MRDSPVFFRGVFCVILKKGMGVSVTTRRITEEAHEQKSITAVTCCHPVCRLVRGNFHLHSCLCEKVGEPACPRQVRHWSASQDPVFLQYSRIGSGSSFSLVVS